MAIDLQLPLASVEALEDVPDEYVEGTFSIAESGGTPGTVKVKFAEFVKGQKFLGLKTLTLNSMVQDPSMIREVLSYETFRAADVVAPRTGYAYVRLNGTDYGLHLNVETMDDVALKRAFGDFDDPQHLYEGPAGVNLAPGSAGLYEVDEGNEEELSDLAEMAREWAVERYIAHWDGYSGQNNNNHFLYSDSNGVFQVLPWGTDQTFYRYWHPFDGEGGTLFEQCLAEPAPPSTAQPSSRSTNLLRRMT